MIGLLNVILLSKENVNNEESIEMVRHCSGVIVRVGACFRASVGSCRKLTPQQDL